MNVRTASYDVTRSPISGDQAVGLSWIRRKPLCFNLFTGFAIEHIEHEVLRDKAADQPRSGQCKPPGIREEHFRVGSGHSA